jgi:hypothetical protein
MENGDDKLARLVADLQKAVLSFELYRGRDDRPRGRKPRRRR